MTTVNLVNPFWGGDKYTYWRMSLFNPERQLVGNDMRDLAFAETAGGTNLLPSAVAVTAPGASSIPSLYDGDPATVCFGVGDRVRIPGNECYIQAQFAAPKKVSEVRITGGISGGTGGSPLAFGLAASNDGVTWVGYGVYTSSGYSASETKTFAIVGPADNGGRAGSRVWIAYRTDTPSYEWRLSEVEFCVGAGGADLATGGVPVGDQTTLPYTRANAFDNFNTTQWGTTIVGSSYIGYVFPTAPNPTHYRFTTSVTGFRSQVAWNIYYLSNCATWVEADSRDYTAVAVGDREVLEFEMAA